MVDTKNGSSSCIHLDVEIFLYLRPKYCIFILYLQVLMIQTLINKALGFLVYFLIVKKRGTLTSFLTGFGIIIPLVFYVPYLMVQMFDLRNIVVVTGSIWGTPIVTSLRCIEGK